MHKSAEGFTTTVERWTVWAPLIILLYFAVQVAVRLWLSPNLEIESLTASLGQRHSAESEPVVLSQLYLSGTGNMAKLTVQRWQRREPAP